MRKFSFLLVFIAAISAPRSIVHAQELYGADGAQGNLSNLYILDPADGSIIETVGPIGFAVTGMAIDPTTGVMYGSTGGQDPDFPRYLITIDPDTGLGTAVGQISDEGPAADIAFTSDGVLYGWVEREDKLGLINKETAETILLPDNGISTYGSGLIAASDDLFYFTGTGDTFDPIEPPFHEGYLHTIERSDGSIFAATPLVGGSGEYFSINALAVDCGGTIHGARIDFNIQELRPVDLITIDPDTGQITVLGQTVDRIDALAFSPFCESDLSVEVVASPNPVTVGNVATAGLLVGNGSEYLATNVTVTANLPNGLNFAFASGGCTEAGGVVTCAIDRLHGNSSQMLHIAFTTATVGMRSITAEVTFGAEDPDPNNNSDVDGLDIIAPPCFVIMRAESLLPHGAAPGGGGTEIGVDLLALNGVEPRGGGPQKIEIVTDTPLDPATVNESTVQVQCTNDPPAFAVSLLSMTSLTISFDEPIAEGQRCEISFNGMASSLGTPADFRVPLVALAGDMDGSGGVTGGDAALIKPFFNTVIDENFEFPQYDFDRSGAISGGDYSLIKPLLGHLVPECP